MSDEKKVAPVVPTTGKPADKPVVATTGKTEEKKNQK